MRGKRSEKLKSSCETRAPPVVPFPAASVFLPLHQFSCSPLSVVLDPTLVSFNNSKRHRKIPVNCRNITQNIKTLQKSEREKGKKKKPKEEIREKRVTDKR